MEPNEMLAKLEEIQAQIADFYQTVLEETKGGGNVTGKKYEEPGSEDVPMPRTTPQADAEESAAPEMQAGQSTGGRAISPEDFMNMKKKI